MTYRKKRMMRPVSASELAQMGMCERLIVYEHCHGKRSPASQCCLTEHERFYREAVRASNKNGRCDIATLFGGEGAEIAALRLLRDRVLRKGALGWWLIGSYYRSVKAICAVLVQHAWLQPLVRRLIKPVDLVARRALRRKKGRL